MYNVLHFLGFQVNIRDVCVLTAPVFSALTALSAYALTKEAYDTASGVVAAAIISIVPGYISRSVAGSYDNEGVAITAMIFCFYLWTKAVNTGSLFWSGMATLSYLYMVACWGGYFFLINLIPVYVLVLLFTGRYSHRLYVAYNTFYVLGTLLSMQIRFVGFNAVQTYEHLGAFGTFGLINLYCVTNWVRSFTGPRVFKSFVRWLALFTSSVLVCLLVASLALDSSGRMTGRIRTFLDPTYASKHIPIIASVSEHQPTAWGSYFFDLHLTVYLMPIGLYFCFKKLSDANMFLITYGAFAVYFSGVMVRIMLVLAPAASMLSAIGISETLKCCFRSLQAGSDDAESSDAQVSTGSSTTTVPGSSATSGISEASGRSDSVKKSKTRIRVKKAKSTKSEAQDSEKVEKVEQVEAAKRKRATVIPGSVALCMVAGAFSLLHQYVRHAIWATSEAYSSPSIVLSARGSGGERIFFDDYREAYYWLRQNTAEDAKVMSWWDYGYQISGMANRTVIVDNNTWNNSHIATVGKAMNSPEEVSYKVARKLDVDYVLVVFGGLVGYSSDDINKFLWMVRIAGSVDDSVKEQDYLSQHGGYTVGANAGKALVKSLMYNLCYYRFGDAGQGYDRVRQTQIPNVGSIKLKYFEEAFTSEHWMVRIYRVKKADARGWV